VSVLISKEMLTINTKTELINVFILSKKSFISFKKDVNPYLEKG